MSDSRSGEVLAGKYRLEALLGSGGMGEVYRAENIQIGRTVAIKLLRPECAQQPTTVQRFLREARAANKVKHPNVVDVLDVGEDAQGVPFIVQEFLQGHDLAQHFEDLGGRISPQTALAILLPVVEAVAEAHRSGVVHRDLKLENVFLSRVGDKMIPKVLDFGISHIATDTFEPRLTGQQVALGTPLYMAPEQIRGLRFVDARSDVWSIGVMLFELMAGEPPFMGESQGELFLSIATDKPKSLPATVDSVLALIIYRCLQKDPGNRYQSAADIAKDLKSFLTDRAKFELELSEHGGGMTSLDSGLGLRRPSNTGPIAVPATESEPSSHREVATVEERALKSPAVREAQSETLTETATEPSSESVARAVPRKPTPAAGIDSPRPQAVEASTHDAPTPSDPGHEPARKVRPSQDKLAAAGATPQMLELEPARNSHSSNSQLRAIKTAGPLPTPAAGSKVVQISEPIAVAQKLKFRSVEEAKPKDHSQTLGVVGFALIGVPALVLVLVIFAVPILPPLRERLVGGSPWFADVFGVFVLGAAFMMSRVGGGVNYRYVDWDLLLGALASVGAAFSLFALAHPALAVMVGQREAYAVFDKVFPWCLSLIFLTLGIYGLRKGVDRLQSRGADVAAGVVFGVSFALTAISVRTTIDAIKTTGIVTVAHVTTMDDDFDSSQQPTVVNRTDAGPSAGSGAATNPQVHGPSTTSNPSAPQRRR